MPIESREEGINVTGAVQALAAIIDVAAAQLVFGLVLAALLGGCVAHQARINTLEMIGDIARVRQTQVLRNLSAAISDPDGVPAVVVLGAGQATASVAGGANPDALAEDTWTSQWQIATVTNSEDLRRLRNLYALITATDAQYDIVVAYFRRHPQEIPNARCGGHDGTTRSSGAPASPAPGRANEEPAANLLYSGDQNLECPPGFGPGRVATWRLALNVLEVGDSLGCRLYQEQPRKPPATGAGLPFRRWLYWRRPGATWGPDPPDTPPQSLGTIGNWELGTTSQACFNDFTILVQTLTPSGGDVAQPKLMLSR
jgi:hypothetical protein